MGIWWWSGWWFGTMEFYDFPSIGNVIIPTDELIFFRGVGQPPTSHKLAIVHCWAGRRKYQREFLIRDGWIRVCWESCTLVALGFLYMSRHLSIRYIHWYPLWLKGPLPCGATTCLKQTCLRDCRGVCPAVCFWVYTVYCCSDLFPSRRTFLSCRSPVDGKYRELETGEHSTQAPAFWGIFECSNFRDTLW